MHVIGIDGHKKTHTLVAVDPLGRRSDEVTVAATPTGHAQAIKWIGQFGQVLLAIEDCRHLTRRFEADLLLAGHEVVRVHTRLMAGARRSARERGSPTRSTPRRWPGSRCGSPACPVRLWPGRPET